MLPKINTEKAVTFELVQSCEECNRDIINHIRIVGGTNTRTSPLHKV